MPLFKTIGRVKKYIAVAYSNGAESLPKSMEAAEKEYLLPVVGKDLLSVLQTEADGLNAGAPSEFLDLAYAALAFLMYYKELPFIHTLITDAGIKNVTTQNMTGAFRYQYEDLRNETENNGLAALERLYQFLMDNIEEPDFADWANSDAYKRLNRNLIRTGSTFTACFSIQHPHRTFYALQPIVSEVEDFFIIPSIGKATFEELRDAAAPTAAQLTVIDSLQRAIANLTINKAISKLSVKVRPEGFTVLLGTGADRAQQGEASASQSHLQPLAENTSQDGNTYLNRAIDYLQANASAEVFNSFFNSSFYKKPNTKTRNTNDYMTGVVLL